MKVRYWWTEDGEMEICDVNESFEAGQYMCYHCSQLRHGLVYILHPADGSEYRVCASCFKKACQPLQMLTE